MTREPGYDEAAVPPTRFAGAMRFLRYSVISLITVPVGYTLLVLARARWNVNAGLLNLAVGTVLTPPSFVLYRLVVWRDHPRDRLHAEILQFWLSVVAGAMCSSLLIAIVDELAPRTPWLIVLAGLAGQGIVFVARFLWLDRVTFAPATDGTSDPAAP